VSKLTREFMMTREFKMTNRLRYVLRSWMRLLCGANDFYVATLRVDEVKCMCELAWPDRTFSPVPSSVVRDDNFPDNPNPLMVPDRDSYLRNMVDDETGETAESLYERSTGLYMDVAELVTPPIVAKSSRKPRAVKR
jgi:hypothetical protein